MPMMVPLPRLSTAPLTYVWPVMLTLLKAGQEMLGDGVGLKGYCSVRSSFARRMFKWQRSSFRGE